LEIFLIGRMETYINWFQLLSSMKKLSKMLIAKISDETYALILEEKEKVGTWDMFLKDVVLQYKREKKESSEALIETKQMVDILKGALIETKQMVDILKDDREYLKKRVEELEKKLNDVGNVSNG
jgi:transcription antitermination factor NusG